MALERISPVDLFSRKGPETGSEWHFLWKRGNRETRWRGRESIANPSPPNFPANREKYREFRAYPLKMNSRSFDFAGIQGEFSGFPEIRTGNVIRHSRELEFPVYCIEQVPKNPCCYAAPVCRFLLHRFCRAPHEPRDPHSVTCETWDPATACSF